MSCGPRRFPATTLRWVHCLGSGFEPQECTHIYSNMLKFARISVLTASMTQILKWLL